jgi:restriction endonuclease S subunit
MSAPLSKLGDQTTIIMGQSPPGESYNKERAGFPLLNGPTEFGPIHPTEKQWTTEPTKLCEPGDALFCVRGATAGRLNVADKTYCLGRGLAAIRSKPGKFDAGFLLHILRNGYAKFQARGVGSTFINISSEELSKFEVPALPLAEQRRIAGLLDRAEALQGRREPGRPAISDPHTNEAGGNRTHVGRVELACEAQKMTRASSRCLGCAGAASDKFPESCRAPIAVE